MTVKEFAEKLRRGGGQVVIEEESTLDASSHQVSRAVADALDVLLPQNATIYHGLQASALKRGPTWSGELQWLLLLDRDLLQLRGKISSSENKSTFELEHQLHPLRLLAGAT